MNKERRKRRDSIIEQIEEIIAGLEELRDDEESVLENMPENLQESERAEKMQENIDVLQELLDGFESQKEALAEVD